MLTQELLDKYNQLKQKKDAAYIVFKKEPSMVNATRHSVATQAFTTFCIDAMTALAEADSTPGTTEEEILADFEIYKDCDKCGLTLLHLVDDQHFIAHSSFVKDFPGWCHTCLVEHCCTTPCESCLLVRDTESCPYKEIKKIYMEAKE